MNTKKKKLTLAIGALLGVMGLVDYAAADLTGTIPTSALSNRGKKVTICHFPPGNPDNYQVITISTSALNTHIDHHDDVFAVSGKCPAIPKTSRWQYLNGPGSWNPTTGKPNTLASSSCSIPNDLIGKVKQRLPEGQPIGNDPQALAMLTDDKGANMALIKDATVEIAYVAEGAGYLNSVGFFTFKSTDLDSLTLNQITPNEKVMFPNFSDNVLKFGDSVKLGSIPAGSSVGFTILANAFKNGMVNENQADKNIFRTIKRLNPEPSSNNLNAHTVLFADVENKMLVLAFEDLNREKASNNDYGYTSDNDFNDVVIAICVDPFDAVDTGTITKLDPTPTPVTGQSGPTAFREITSPDTVTDPVKDAQAEVQKATNAAGNLNNGVGNLLKSLTGQ